MIGSAQGIMVSTAELQGGQTVLVDHQEFQVVEFEPLPEGVAVVLAPAYGHSWTVQVHEVDCQEPMWEIL